MSVLQRLRDGAESKRMYQAWYITSMVFRWAAAWAVLAVFFDIPEPGIVYWNAYQPEAALVVTLLVIFILAKDAAKWHKHQAGEAA